jgi:gluconokinase
MKLLCFDVASGGISAALFDVQLRSNADAEIRWDLETDARGAATLSAETVVQGFAQSIRSLNLTFRQDLSAVCIGTFMHNCVLLGEADQPLSPVFTWLDRRGESGVDYVRSALGERFHQITGCRYHPMFPVFKLASVRAIEPDLFQRIKRVVSVKALLLNRLTGVWIEDHGIASASGLFNITKGEWDPEVLALIGLEPAQLPVVRSRTAIAGSISSEAAAEFNLNEGIPVIVGSGDGFFANMGSECEVPGKLAVTLGTSAVARQTLRRPVLDPSAGAFCYRADERTYLLGCAGNNGGNVLDWARRIFNRRSEERTSGDPPVFIPLLYGERSPEWDPHLTASWHGIRSTHTAADLARSVLEGVIFNLAHFVEIVQQASSERAGAVVLSGNGFLHPMSAAILAAVTGIPTWMPETPGFASLRGAGICALRALSEPEPPLMIEQVLPFPDSKILTRYQTYRSLRSRTPP